MPRQPATRRQFLKRSMVFPVAAAAIAGLSRAETAFFASASEEEKRLILGPVQTPPGVRQTDILFDPASYTAFPHVARLDGDELLIAFRQAPRQERVRHTHPRSVITVMRSYNLGETWDAQNAGQFAAGGGQEFAPIYLGQGRVGGVLAMHAVVPVGEGQRAGLGHEHAVEYPFANVGGFWCWSDNHGLTWPLHHAVLFAPGKQPSSPPIRLQSGTLLAPSYGRVGSDSVTSALLHRSSDLGQTWSSMTLMAKGSNDTREYGEPALLELEKDKLLALHRVEKCVDGRSGLFWRNESHDGGKSWSQPTETNILSGACPRLLKLSDGRVLLTFGRRYKPYGLLARLSDDGGQTWGQTSWLLRKAPNGNQGYSSSIEIEPGRIFTACYAQNSQGVTGITGTFWNLREP